MKTIRVATIVCLLFFSGNVSFPAAGLQEIQYKSTADGSDQPAMFFAPETDNPPQWDKPLAQDYVIVHQVRELNQKDRWVCVGSPDLLRLPSGQLLVSMELWLKTPTSGIEGGIDYPNHCLIKASNDGGKTWRQIGTTGVTWGSLFTIVGNWFLEGNVVEIRDQLVVLLRTRIDVQLTSGMTSICHLEDNGRQMRYRFVQFYPMIGGQNKFKLLFDDRSHLYWTCTAFVPDPYQDPEPLEQMGFKGNPANMRRILLLNYSLDGLNWLPAGCVAMSRNPLESFHYSSQVIDGDDLLVLSRSSVGGRPPYNNHDSNMITLHRVRNFRSLALDLKPVLPESSATQ